jgi:enoyl-CoA hydratase/carnithine racemase
VTSTETTGTDTVHWSLEDAVATVTLNRPRARNALTAEMKDGLLAALRRAARPSLRCARHGYSPRSAGPPTTGPPRSPS